MSETAREKADRCMAELLAIRKLELGKPSSADTIHKDAEDAGAAIREAFEQRELLERSLDRAARLLEMLRASAYPSGCPPVGVQGRCPYGRDDCNTEETVACWRRYLLDDIQEAHDEAEGREDPEP